MVDRSRYASTVPKNQTPGLIFNLFSTAAGKGFTKEVWQSNIYKADHNYRLEETMINGQHVYCIAIKKFHRQCCGLGSHCRFVFQIKNQQIKGKICKKVILSLDQDINLYPHYETLDPVPYEDKTLNPDPHKQLMQIRNTVSCRPFKCVIISLVSSWKTNKRTLYRLSFMVNFTYIHSLKKVCCRSP
jgi:hypothetical protein